MADNQQPQQQASSPGVFGTVGNILSQALPYALPAALGAAMGGIGGAAAGAGLGAEGLQEAQERQQEIGLRQQEMAMRWQQFGLESMQAQEALKTKQSWDEYVQTLPEDQRALAMENPQEFTKNKIEDGNWRLGLETLKKDPTLGARPELIASLEQMGPLAGRQALEAYIKATTSGKFPNGVHMVTNADGTSTLVGVGADNSITPLYSGINPTVANQSAAQRTRVATLVDKRINDLWKNESGFTTRMGLFHGMTYDQFVKENRPKVESEVEAEVGGSGPMATHGAGVSELPKPPKELWGKTGTLNGRRVKIDKDGNVTPL